MNNKIKGDDYEIQIRDYIINNLYKQAYLWSDVPEKILIQYGIINNNNQNRLLRKNKKENNIPDTGIDIIQLDEGSISLVQCKNGYNKGLTMKDLSGFMCWMAILNQLKGYIYYTDKLSIPLQSLPKTDRIEFIKKEYHKIEPIDVRLPNKYIPFDYQLDAKSKFETHFKNNDRGILWMPCGTGKTFTSYLISNNYDQIIILSPLRQFAKQNLEKYIDYGYSNKTLLVDSDGERDINTIKNFINLNKKFLISSTYCSADVINQCLKYCNNPLIIIDEFHNLSKSNIFDEHDDMNQIIDSYYRILFMSATPRVYELEDESFDYDLFFGKVVYQMSFSEALNKKYITDYKIWLPSITENNNKLNNELKIYEINNIIKAKCNFLFSCLLNHGSKKCIIYCQDKKEINEMIDAINKLNEYYILDLEINQITNDNTQNQRQEILTNFEKSEKKQLLFSIRILDECIDIPTCDSVYITYHSNSKIRTIQRLSRCIRIDKNNNNKIGNIYIWCDEYSKILGILGGIKEYDENFCSKIDINEINFFGESTKENIKSDKKLINNYIIGIKEHKQLLWEDKLKLVEEFININNKRPSNKSTDEYEKKLGNWIKMQLEYYRDNKYIFENKIYKILWEKFINDPRYSIYFIDEYSEWFTKFNLVKNFIIKNKRRPTHHSMDNDEKKLGNWLIVQLRNYESKISVMKNDNIRNEWVKFKEEFINYFVDHNENWNKYLMAVKKYIDDNNKKPSICTNDINIKKIGYWLVQQIQKYKNQTDIMKDDSIRIIWESFINDHKYKRYFISNEEIWNNKFNELKIFINNNNKRPCIKDNIYSWYKTQNYNYLKNKDIMSNEKIRNIWNKFQKENSQYLK